MATFMKHILCFKFFANASMWLTLDDFNGLVGSAEYFFTGFAA